MEGAATIAGLTFLLNGLTKPAVDELGGILGDRVAVWRANNLLKILEAGNGLLSVDANRKIVLNPKLVLKIANAGSYESDADLQKMWAGLLVTSIDESNSTFVSMLEPLTSSQAKFLEYLKTKTTVRIDRHGLLMGHEHIDIPVAELNAICGHEDLQRHDREMDLLRESGLIEGGFNYDQPGEFQSANVNLHGLGISFLTRTAGQSDPLKVFKQHASEPEEVTNEVN